jgi:transposase
MEVIHERCAGLDVHKDTVVGCLRVQERGQVRREVRRWATTTAELLELGDWLRQAGCTHVAMEATGVYWKPVWHVLEGEFELILANPAHIRNVPGRKSDVNDATWIADLLAHGLIRASLVPPSPIQELRDLTRTRKQLMREIVQHKQRIQKVLEDANVKLASVVSDVFGESGRRMLKAISAGQTDARQLAALGDGRLSASRETLAAALHGKVTAHHRFLLSQHFRMIEYLEQTVAAFEARIEAAVEPFRAAIENLVTIPGVSATAAHVIIAEIGVDMSRFAKVGHLRSWAGLCPELHESAGKVMSRRLRHGAPWLKTGAVRVGGHPQQDQLSPRPVRKNQSAARIEKGHHCGGRIYPYHRLLFTSQPGAVSGSRSALFRAYRPGANRAAPGASNQRPRLRSPNSQSSLITLISVSW